MMIYHLKRMDLNCYYKFSGMRPNAGWRNWPFYWWNCQHCDMVCYNLKVRL